MTQASTAPHIEPPDPAVIPDCPSWCRLPAGHMYSNLSHDLLGVTRDHDSDPHCLLAAVVQTEVFQDGTVRLEQPRVEILPPEIDVEVLTSEQARARAIAEAGRGRAIAIELREAATLLDTLTAGSATR
ncbi:MAG: hypothetical protein ACR2FG_15370 [Marmoricola sp.]